MSRKVLNKNIEVIDNKAIITEKIETTLDRRQLESKLEQLRRHKSRIEDQIERLSGELGGLGLEEQEILELLEVIG